MLRLAGILYGMIGTTAVGVCFVIARVIGADTVRELLGAVFVGLIVSAPLTYFITRSIARS